MKNPLYAFLLVALVIVVAGALVITGHEVPSFLETIGLFSAGAGTGLALPAAKGSTADDLG